MMPKELILPMPGYLNAFHRNRRLAFFKDKN